MDRDGDASLDECIAFTLLTLRCCGPVRDSLPRLSCMKCPARPRRIDARLLFVPGLAGAFARGDFDRLRRSIADAEVSPSTLL